MSSSGRLYTLALIAMALALSYKPACSASANAANALAKWRAENKWDAGGSAAGASNFGFTYRTPVKDGPRCSGWSKILDQGKARAWTKYYNDANRNGVMDGSEAVSFNYWIWYDAKIRVEFAWERAFNSGKEWMAFTTEGWKNARPVAIGDGGMATDTECCAYKGPLYVYVTMRIGWDGGGQALYYGDDPDLDASYSAIVEGSQLAAKYRSYITQRPSVLTDLVQYIISDSPVGKTAAAKPAAKKPVAAKPKGTPGLKLIATPAALWADGKSTSKLTFKACDAKGIPIKDSFDIDVAHGQCSHIKFITNAAGVATATYRAPLEPGEDTVTVTGPGDAKASLIIRLGGIKLVPKNPDQPVLFADGKTKMGLTVICGDPSFKPLAGAKVKLVMDEKELPAKGKLSAQAVTIGADGKAAFEYLAPDIYSAKSNFRRGNAYVSAVANLGNPPKPVKAIYRIPLYTGQVYYLKVTKAGFKDVEKFKIPAPNRNGELSGSVVCSIGGKTTPVAYAELVLAGSDGKALGKGSSGEDGGFRFQFVGDQMSSTGQAVELNEPIKMESDADMMRMLDKWKADLDALEKKTYDVDSLKEFAADLPKNLAASRYECGDPMCSTDYLVYTGIRMAHMCKYLKLLDERQLESSAWFVDSMKNIIGTVADFAAVSDKLGATAKGKLKNKFAPKTWQKFEDSVLREFMDILYQQLQKGVDIAKTMNYDTEALDAFKKFGAEAAAKKGIDKLAEGLQAGFNAGIRSSTQRILTKVGSQALRGQIGTSAPSECTAAVQDAFTTFEKEHNELNIEHMNRELYRLDAKVFTDTVIKGPFLYLNLKKLVLDPDVITGINELDTKTIEKIQDEFIGKGDTVSKVFSAFDAMFQAYQGYNWMVDFCKAGTVRKKIVETLTQ